MNKLSLFRLITVAALALLVGLPAMPALADSTATITVFARGATMGQPFEVQWGDPLGGWHTVDGWKGTLDNINPQGVPFVSLGVFSGNFGQGPFRWVIYYPDGKTIWAIGPSFNLPSVAGTDYAQPLDVQNSMPPVTTPSTPAPPGPVPPVTGGLLLNGHTFTYGLTCFGGNCDHSKITALIGGLPSSIWITVQWQDPLGQWHTVDGWQGGASSVDAFGGLFQQWDIGPELFGRGPFRWALYNFQGGSLIGVSPNFNMPATAQLNLYMSMAPY